ncbi:hypothetical protein ACFPRL_22090 [Pseudoclavibacter helvolus]
MRGRAAGSRLAVAAVVLDGPALRLVRAARRRVEVLGAAVAAGAGSWLAAVRLAQCVVVVTVDALVAVAELGVTTTSAAAGRGTAARRGAAPSAVAVVPARTALVGAARVVAGPVEGVCATAGVVPTAAVIVAVAVATTAVIATRVAATFVVASPVATAAVVAASTVRATVVAAVRAALAAA